MCFILAGTFLQIVFILCVDQLLPDQKSPTDSHIECNQKSSITSKYEPNDPKPKLSKDIYDVSVRKRH